MAQGENLNSENTWVWNCGNKNDLDYRSHWKNNPNGTLTIARHNLIGVKYFMNCWNPIDNWNEVSGESMLTSPVENYTFDNIALVFTVAIHKNADDYWGLKYKIETKLVVIYGDPPGEIQENIITKTWGCFTKNDPYYYNKFGCIPPDRPC